MNPRVSYTYKIVRETSPSRGAGPWAGYIYGSDGRQVWSFGGYHTKGSAGSHAREKIRELRGTNPGRYRHEDVSAVPAGWKTRTVSHGDHRVRVAFPPGRRKTGSGRLVSILHPAGENPCALRSTNPAELVIMGANPPRSRNAEAREQSVFAKHQIRIAKETLKMSDAMVGVMGGMSKEQARAILHKHGIKFRENSPQPIGEHRGVPMIYEGISYHAPSLHLRGFSTDLALKRAIDRKLKAAERRASDRPNNPYYSEKIDKGYNRAVIWAGTEAGPFHVNLYSEGVDLGERGRGYSTLQRARKVAQKWLDEQREPTHNPHPGTNPRVEVIHGENPQLETIVEEFSGTPAEWVDVYDEPHMHRGKYAQLGPLIALYVKPTTGGQVRRIGAPEIRKGWRDYWENDPPMIVTDSSAKQIYFVGGNQDITPALEAFGARDCGNGKCELGAVRRIDYECRKEHVATPEEDQWKHDHGEENGVFPMLYFDRNAKRLSYQGGDYRIEGAWIKN